jgi:energy-coupling factor transporter ATP-binding protein EcfA2
MRIRKIKWLDHPILKNLEIDLSKSNGETYDTIIFAGENGTGKTTILDTLSTFLNRGSIKYFDYIEYIVDGQVLKAVPGDPQNPDVFYDMIKVATGERTNMNTGKREDGAEWSNETIDNNPLNIRYNGCAFSKARADFKTNQITSTTGKEIDVSKYDLDKEDDFTSLKQLIVDISEQDYSDYAEKGQRGGDNKWENFYPQSKIFRFQNAFDNFFPKMKYNKVTNSQDGKIIQFKKNGAIIPIENLSTGEKQIVFRGAYLLKKSGKLTNAAIFVDEPEISMHPKWEEKILKYYKDLFTQGNTQNAQMFFATHSIYVIGSVP